MNTITINKKEYRFRDRVVIGKVLEAERLRRQIDLSFLVHPGTGLLARIKEQLAWWKLNRIWLSLCDIVIENPDSGLKLNRLTAAEIHEVPRRFFAFMEEIQKPSGDTTKPSGNSLPDEAAATP